MTSRSRRYFKKKKGSTSSKDWVIDLWSEKICKEVDRQILEEILKEAKAQGIETYLTPEGKLLLNQDI